MLHRQKNVTSMFVLVFSYYISLIFVKHHGIESFSSVGTTTRASIPGSRHLRSSPFTLQAKTDRMKNELLGKDERKELSPNLFQSISASTEPAKALVLSTLLSVVSFSPLLENFILPVNAMPTTTRISTTMSTAETLTSSMLLSSSSVATITQAPPPTTTSITTTSQTPLSSIAKKSMPRLASVMDLAGVLDPNKVTPIVQAIEEAQRKTQTEIQIVIANQVEQGYTPKRMATTLFNQWRLGTSQKNNGILILVVLDERRTEIEVGKALDQAMNAAWCQRTLQETASPAFRREEYSKGLLATVQRVSEKLQEVDRNRGSGGGELTTSTLRTTGGSYDAGARMQGVGLSFTLLFFLTLFNDVRDSLKYPIRVGCPKCNANKETWEIEEPGGWVTTLEATDEQEGEQQVTGTCANCGHVYTETRAIRRYDGSTTDADGNISYYYTSSSSDSGGSSDGGGGGDSW